MSKMMSEEQVFEAFMSHIENVRHISLRKHLASPSPEIYVNQFLKSEYDAFKSAFNLLMPIIEKLESDLSFYADPDNWNDNDFHGIEPSIVSDGQYGNEFGKSKHLFLGGKRARRALRESRQMLEQLGVTND